MGHSESVFDGSDISKHRILGKCRSAICRSERLWVRRKHWNIRLFGELSDSRWTDWSAGRGRSWLLLQSGGLELNVAMAHSVWRLHFSWRECGIGERSVFILR